MQTLTHLLMAFILGGAFSVTGQAITLVRPEAQPSFAGERGVQQPPSQEADELVRQALQLYQQGKFDEALANCTKAAGLSPNNHLPHAVSGYVYMAQMKLKSASEAFAKAIELQPQDKRLYLAKASSS